MQQCIFEDSGMNRSLFYGNQTTKGDPFFQNKYYPKLEYTVCWAEFHSLPWPLQLGVLMQWTTRSAYLMQKIWKGPLHQWFSTRATYWKNLGSFVKILMPRPPPQRFGFNWSWGIGLILKLPGYFNAQPGLRITTLYLLMWNSKPSSIANVFALYRQVLTCWWDSRHSQNLAQCQVLALQHLLPGTSAFTTRPQMSRQLPDLSPWGGSE